MTTTNKGQAMATDTEGKLAMTTPVCRGLLILAIGFGIAIGTAEASSIHGMRRLTNAMVQELDRNGDRRLSRDEFRLPAVRMFQVLDGNEDGLLSSDELKKLQGISSQLLVRRATMRQGTDGINRRDFVSAEQPGKKRGVKKESVAVSLLMRPEQGLVQRREQREKLFSMLDSDGNGHLSTKELKGRRKASQKLFFQTLDADNNGRVEQNEFLSSADATFARMDANANNRISSREISRHMRISIKEMKKQHRQG